MAIEQGTIARKNRKVNISSIILRTLAVGGVLTIAVLAPNALQALAPFYRNKKGNPKYYIRTAISRLQERGFIELKKNREGKTIVRLTSKGAERLRKYQLREVAIGKPKRWDHKWRVIIFDIKEYRREVRDDLRFELMNLGFRKLQNSVWVYPYPCREVFILLKSYYKTGKDILYMTVETIENDRWLKKEFALN